MNKILILIKNNNIIFSKYTKLIDENNFNNTNIIDTKNLKFTDEYINKNMELIASFLNLVILKSGVDTAIIKNIDIGEPILKLLKLVPKINNIIFSEDKDLSYMLSSLLLENNNLNKIECYSMPEMMFNRFSSGIVDTRCEILFTSNFMNYNNINTYSKLCNKDKIIIDNYYIKEDNKEDIIFFFSKNTSLKKIIIKGYTRNTLLECLDLCKVKNITIIIYEDSNCTKEILEDISLFTKLKKQYKVNIKIKYSKEYKINNRVKEVNIIFLRNIILLAVLLIILILVLLKVKVMKDTQSIEENLNIIENTIEDVSDEIVPDLEIYEEETLSVNKSTYISPYNTNYEKVYSKLVELNSDTVGWIEVKNTKINYPVVQYSDNDYYLKHAFNKTNNYAGWIFVDYRCDMNSISKNTIVYGHGIKNKMFGLLTNVLEASWYSNPDNLVITFSIKDKTYYWKIFSIYTIEETNDYLITDFSSDESYKNFIDKVSSRSINNFNENVLIDDKILTLSTCYKDANYRLVVHAKMVNNS